MKKRILLSLPFILLAVSLRAQVKKGDLLLGATLGFNYNSQNNNPSGSNTNISPRLSLGIGHNSTLGLAASFGYNTYKSADGFDKNTGISFGSTLFWKKYYTIKNRFGWYTQLEGSFNTGKVKYKNSTTEFTNRNISYGGGLVPGFYYQVSPRLLLNADVGRISATRSILKNSNGDITSRTTNVNAQFLTFFTFGVDFRIGK